MEGLIGVGSIVALFFGLVFLIAPISMLVRLSKLNHQVDQIIKLLSERLPARPPAYEISQEFEKNRARLR